MKISAAVILSLPLTVTCLFVLIASMFANKAIPPERSSDWQNRSATQNPPVEETPALVNQNDSQHKSTPTARAPQNPQTTYADGKITLPAAKKLSQHPRPITSLSFKPTADFGNTFVGHQQFIMTATNRYSGQTIAIEAIYMDKCMAKWKAYPDSDEPDHLAHLGASLLTGEMLFGEYQCVGLQISTPLHIDDTYIGIEPNKNGSPVELAELPQLVNVIENARPTQPAATP